ncbi:hypothetical protein IWZ01DRAFT_525071 [Phyllosticta capitalensis]
MSSNTSDVGLGLGAPTQGPDKPKSSALNAKTKSVSAPKEQSGASAFDMERTEHPVIKTEETNTVGAMALLETVPEAPASDIEDRVIKKEEDNDTIPGTLPLARPQLPEINLNDDKVAVSTRRDAWFTFKQAEAAAMAQWREAGAPNCTGCQGAHPPPCLDRRQVERRNRFKQAGKRLEDENRTFCTKCGLAHKGKCVAPLCNNCNHYHFPERVSCARAKRIMAEMKQRQREKDQERSRQQRQQQEEEARRQQEATRQTQLQLHNEYLSLMSNAIAQNLSATDLATFMTSMNANTNQILHTPAPQATQPTQPTNRGRGGFRGRGDSRGRGNVRGRGSFRGRGGPPMSHDAHGKRKLDDGDDEGRPTSKRWKD